MNQHFQTSFPDDNNEHSLNDDSRDDGDHFLEEPNSEEENEMEKIELNFPKHPNKKAFHTQIESDSHFRQFYQRQQQHKAATTLQVGKPNSTSPIYNYFGEGNMYLNQKGDDKDDGNVQFNYLKKESLINSPTKSINMEQCAPNYTDFDFFAQQQNFQGNESPIRIGSQMNTNTGTNNNNVNTQVIENLNNSNNNYNDNYENDNDNENELGLSPNPNHVNNNMNMNLDLNNFNNSKYQFNDMMKLMSQQTQFHQQQQHPKQQQQQPFNAVVKENSFNNEYINEQYNNQINPYAFANKQMNSNISGLNQMNNSSNNNNSNFNLNLYNNSNNNNVNMNTNNNNNMNIFNNNNNLLGQNMLNVFNNTNNINNIFNNPFMMNNQHNEYNQQQFPKQHQQQQPLKREDYIFEKFGKKGWQCNHCNNFNFESKYIYNIHITP